MEYIESLDTPDFLDLVEMAEIELDIVDYIRKNPDGK